ncbi:carbohydrate kinase family protein [Diplocloster agilis]|uniref:carbohydrate kinase family protein n=1 Tax=Diplocloster agilis TaxID=2850323 RepID=UPI00082324C3|nr:MULTISPECIES: carbohydrate kinase [Lachnospiraceae]MBU9744788.1 carbohydrate kinase [Diplocloster agilis]MCU6735562.1 carbohydrate kinase [Suonthocola fibrivorans]SCJ76947.1 5-dehydro-2-deoxygluconokinase [uncultured Clostridium sp.]
MDRDEQDNRGIDVISMGDLMIDFTSLGINADGKMLFERNPGGAPANVAAQVCRLGGRSAFMGTVGTDEHGEYLCRVMRDLGVLTDGLIQTEKCSTRITFVYLNEEHERFFSSYRSPRAEIVFSPADIRYDLLDSAKILHIPSSILYDEPAKDAVEAAVTYARGKGKLISYDPNWNKVLGYNSEQTRIMLDFIRHVDVLKISGEEFEYLFDGRPLEQVTAKLVESGVQLVAVTFGKRGCYYRTKQAAGHLPAYQTRVVDTTGAGDSFMGGLLYGLSRVSKKPEELSEKELRERIDFANACGSACAAKRGSLLVMPTMEEVEQTRRNGTSARLLCSD